MLHGYIDKTRLVSTCKVLGAVLGAGMEMGMDGLSDPLKRGRPEVRNWPCGKTTAGSESCCERNKQEAEGVRERGCEVMGRKASLRRKHVRLKGQESMSL